MKPMMVAWSTAVLVALLAGCASTVRLDEGAPVETITPTQVGTPKTDSVEARPRAPETPATPVVSEPPDTPVPNAPKSAPNVISGLARVIYFDFDSYVVKDEFRGIVEGYAKLLTANRSQHVTIEGHADERGGHEYNLALGQKRAEAVLQSLELLGALESQLEAVSFGKERPAVEGHDETAFAKNRRAELNLR